MKILMLTPYLPYPLLSGGQIRTFNLLKQLADKHEITLFALIKDRAEKEYISKIETYCKEVRVFKRSKRPFTPRNIFKTAFSSYPFLVMRNHVTQAVKAIKEELSNNDYDLIHAETFYMMPHLPHTRIPTILAEQTIEYLGYESYAKRTPWPIKQLLQIDINKIKKWERHYWRETDRLIVMSDQDKHYIQKFVKEPQKIEVVANGVDINWFDQKQRRLPSKPTILYVGTFKWLPNIEAVEFLVEEVWPHIKRLIPQAQLKIVGNAPTNKILSYRQSAQDVIVTGRVADIRDAFKQSHVLVAPVFSGKGTRYKILEAMACGTPIVASHIAVEGLNIDHKKQALISNNPQKMAQYTAQIVQDQSLWSQLSNQGYEFVKNYYDWPLIAQKLDVIYQSMN